MSGQFAQFVSLQHLSQLCNAYHIGLELLLSALHYQLQPWQLLKAATAAVAGPNWQTKFSFYIQNENASFACKLETFPASCVVVG